jgi:hypothetical protein
MRIALGLLLLTASAPALGDCPHWTIPTIFHYPSPVTAPEMLLADMDGDGHPDAITVLPYLQIAHGRDSGFGRIETPEPQFFFSAAAVADFNRDGRLDLVRGFSAGADDASAEVQLGGANGSLGEAKPLGPLQPLRLAAADLNGDGRPDVVAINSANEVLTLIGDGSGGFGEPTHTGARSQSSLLATADFNGDGMADVALADADVRVFVSDGRGGLRVYATLPLGGVSSGLAAGDFDGDGRIDLAASIRDSNTVVVLLAGGNGFREAARLATSASPAQIVVTDFDKNHADDLAVVSKDSVTLWLGGSGGAFRRAPDVPFPGARSVAVQDVSGDGLPDLVVYNQSQIGTFPGLGNGRFRTIEDSPGASAFRIATGDLDGDGDTDIVELGIFYTLSFNTPTSTILRNQGGALFGSDQLPYIDYSPRDLRLADVDGDGRPEILVVAAGQQAVANYTMQPAYVNVYRLHDGKYLRDFTFKADGVPSTSIATGDFDGDGRMDVAILTAPGNMDIVAFRPGPQVIAHFAVPENAGPIAAADFNGDGILDLLLLRHYSEYPLKEDGSVSVLPGLGGGRFGDAIFLARDVTAHQAKLGDFDGDGRPDVLIDGADVKIAYTNGFAFDVRSIDVSTCGEYFGPIQAIADADGDGHDDLFASNGEDAIRVLYMGGRNAPLRNTASFSVDVPYQATFAVADVDGIEGADVVTSNYETEIYRGVCGAAAQRRRAR